MRSLLILLCSLLAACAHTPPPAVPAPAAISPDAAMAALAQRFLDGYFELNPPAATAAGDHRYDGRWPDVTVEGEQRLRTFLDGVGAELAKLPREGMSVQHRIDAATLEDQLRLMAFNRDELKVPERDPLFYVALLSRGLDPLVTRGFATKQERLTPLVARLQALPSVVAAAKQRLTRPPKVFTETAIQQVEGLQKLADAELEERFADVPDRALELAAAAKVASAALKDFHAFLKTDLLPRSDGSFRLGRERFTARLAQVLQDEVDPDALAASARALLTQTQTEMVETATQIWTAEKLGKLPPLRTAEERKSFVKKVLDHVAKDRPTNATVIVDAKRRLDEATAFVRARDLVRVPDQPLAVIEMPEYRRGVAVAYCDSAGPLEAKPETFYAIAPTPKDWTPARSESFYREYNQAMLANLAVHEGVPGHYLQIVHNNQFASKLRAVFSSGVFIEGWGVYSEWLMAEKGFGGPRVKLQRQKMLLRLAVNALLDHGVHAGTMEEKEGLALMMGEAFQEEGEAVGKWKRALLSSAQLTTYFYGFTEFLKLRRAAEGASGFTERAYHDRLLSWGAPGMKFVRQLTAAGQ